MPGMESTSGVLKIYVLYIQARMFSACNEYTLNPDDWQAYFWQVKRGE
jgi:hypothetical protein